MPKGKAVLIAAIFVMAAGILMTTLVLTSCKRDESAKDASHTSPTQTESLQETTDKPSESDNKETIGESPGQDKSGDNSEGTIDVGSHLLLSASSPPSIDGFLQNEIIKIGSPGVDFKLLETGDPIDWEEIPIPFINPMGARNLYNKANYNTTGTSYIVMQYLEGYTEYSYRAYGENWVLNIKDDDLTMNYLRWYALEIGATLYDNSDDRITFSIKENGNLWWATASWKTPDAKETTLRIVKQDILEVNQILTITPDDTDGGYYSFSTLADNGEFLTAIIEIYSEDEKAEVRLKAMNYFTAGQLTRRFEYRKSMYLSHMDKYSLNDIPQTDMPVFWRIQLPSGRELDKVTIKFENSGSIEPIIINDVLGSIRVIGAAGATKVSDQSSIFSISHESGFSYNGKKDGDGNTVFYLPAGYYNINTNLPGGGNGSIRMIPVNGGERTDVVFPDEFKETYSALETMFGGFDTNIGSISILDNTDLNDIAETAILINDPLKRDVFPEADSIIITEGGEKAEIIDIKREIAPVNVVLVFDTSGSMIPYMKTATQAAKRFVDGLPDGINIKLISFEKAITVHDGEGKEAVKSAIDTLVARGSTALYDASDKAISLLGDKDNAFVVVFSDGADSREPGVTGTGSDLTQIKLRENITDTDITFLTIGFSEGHDPAALIAISDANGKGAYFSAIDETMLDQAFAAVSTKFGNQFIINYKRPESTLDIKSQEPVISIMLDDSGSMGHFREGVISLFYDFLNGLPEKSLIQLSKFADRVDMMHITTDQKAPLMQAMGESGETGRGTKVLKALEASYNQIKPLPTDKKVFIFLSDEAMAEVNTINNLSQSERIFKQYREEGIRCLFLGVAGASNVEESYKFAAEQTDGEYLITNKLGDIEQALQKLLSKVNEPVIKGDYINFTIGIRAATDDGSIMDYYATKKLMDFSSRSAEEQDIEMKTAKIITGGRLIPLFDHKIASLITGGANSSDDNVVLTNRIVYAEAEPEKSTSVPSIPTDGAKFNKTKNNDYLEITVKESFTFDAFGGVRAKKDHQFIALELELHFPNTDSSIEAYQIPSIKQHFYLSLNNGNSVPASTATWLAEKPIVSPGETKISIKRGEKISGLLVFYTGKPETILQLGFHFYDTVNGHIHIPLTGKIQEDMMNIDNLPKNNPVKIADAFSMYITGYADLNEYGSYEAVTEENSKNPGMDMNTLLRTVQVDFDSRVQALLKLDPQKRFFYSIKTDKGLLMSKMNNIVHNIPLGFTGDTMVAPGASNKVYLPYEIPAVFSEKESYIFGDVKNSDVLIPVTEGETFTSPSKNVKLSHEYFDVVINDLSYSPLRPGTIVLDITVEDIKDGFSTTGINRMFALENINESNEKKRYVEFMDERLLYGIDSDWVAFDGRSRRGVLLFDIGRNGNIEAHVLRSIHFPELKLEIENKPYPNPQLLISRNEPPIDDSFEKELNKAVSATVAQYRATKVKPETDTINIAFSQEDIEGTVVSSPESASFGRKVLSSIETEKDFHHLMYAIKWLPSGAGNEYYYAPEAVISQEWGSQFDIYMLAENALSRLGIRTDYRELAITQKGKDALKSIGGISDIGRIDTLPALAYTNDEGEMNIFVIPFMRDIKELTGLVYLPASALGKKPSAATVELSVIAQVLGESEQAGGGQNDMFNALSDATGGTATETKEKIEKDIILLSEELSIPSLSLGAVDIGYFVAVKNKDGDDIIKAVVETTDGLLQGSDGIDTGKNEVKGVKIHFNLKGAPKDGYVHTTLLEGGQKITDICHTLAFALPETSEKTIQYMELERKEALKGVNDQANDASIVKWFARSTIYRYIGARTRYDNNISDKLELVLGRVSNPMAVVVTTRSDGTNALASIDLMHHNNQILEGGKDNANAYRLFSGMYASILEGEAIADGSGINILDLWKPASEGEGFLYIDNSSEARKEALESLSDKYPKRLKETIQSAIDSRSDTVFLIPKEPGFFGGEPRWAWLEIDSGTYDAISVFDNGERAGLAGYAMGLMSNKTMQGYIGFFVGVNCSAWSISAYSLVMADPEDIENAAAALCAEILKQLQEMMGVTGSKGAVDYFGGKIKDNVSLKGVSISDVEGFLSPKVKTPGFVEGFEAAMSIYFD